MDPLGLLLEIVALTVYPGGLFLGALAWITWRGAGLPRGGPLDLVAVRPVDAVVELVWNSLDAEANNVTVVGITETIQPPGEEFEVWMNAEYLALANALNSKTLGQ